MSTKFLQAYLGNAVELAEEMLPQVANAQVGFTELLRFCGHYRLLGIGLLLQFADGAPLQKYLWKSGRAYLHVLGRLGEEAKVTSRGRPFFDAIAALDFDGARDIAAASRTTRADVEYEEDFLFPYFLMKRFFLHRDDAEDEAILMRWTKVLEGAPDARLDVSRALFTRDSNAFDQAVQEYLESVKRHYARLEQKELLLDEEIATEGKVSIEGLALVTLAQRLGLTTRPDYLFVPSLALPRAPLTLAADAWTRVRD